MTNDNNYKTNDNNYTTNSPIKIEPNTCITLYANTLYHKSCKKIIITPNAVLGDLYHNYFRANAHFFHKKYLISSCLHQ